MLKKNYYFASKINTVIYFPVLLTGIYVTERQLQFYNIYLTWYLLSCQPIKNT